MKRIERVLFHMPRGHNLNRGYGGVPIDPSVLAFSSTDEDNQDGLYAVYGQTLDPEEFIVEFLGIEFIPDGTNGCKRGNGQWVYEVEYDEDNVPVYDPDVGDEINAKHLLGGKIRRMTPEELGRMADGGCPFEGGQEA